MGTRDPRVDAYIARSAEFARPILTHLREIVHAECPDVEETLKWNAPHFMYRGMLAGMSSFKAHCAFGFWRGSLVTGADGDRGREAMGQFGRITALDDLPPKRVIARYVREAMQLNEEGVKVPRPRKHGPKPELQMPAELMAALRTNARAQATFEAFSPSHRREYVEWIAEAKSEETRGRRLASAIEWMAEGRSRNWKYQSRSRQ
jgi:uncharacterized protein YdeI (YjbR/CyaY-like superfamily)